MLEEYVVTPDVFIPAAYKEQGACGVSLRWFKDAVLEDGLLRDLRGGDWSRFCAALGSAGHSSTKEILTKLIAGKRLRKFDAQLDYGPTTSSEWLAEGIATQAVEPVTGIITAHATPASTEVKNIASIEKVTGANWWRARSCSKDLKRSTADYLSALTPVLLHANSLMFIDPNLDPGKLNYKNFADLLRPIQSREIKPIIEIHRSIALGDGISREFLKAEDWQLRFRPLNDDLAAMGLKATVLFWNDFHDRFLVSDLIGLSVSSGFDTTSDPNSEACWSRLGRTQRDARQRRFDPAVRGDLFKFKFEIGYGA